jgi:hypothetical protein
MNQIIINEWTMKTFIIMRPKFYSRMRNMDILLMETASFALSSL